MNWMMNHIKWRHIATIGILTLSIVAAVFVRVKEADQLQDKYLSGYDSYFYYRQAKTIITEGRLPDRDYMQNYPDGLNLRGRANLNCYAIAYLYKGIRIFAPDISIESVAIYYPVILFILILIIFFGLTNLLFGKPISLIAVTILATIPAALARTHAGWADRDPLSLLAWLACLYFFVAAYQALSQERQRYLPLALLSGISMGALGLTWPGVGLLSIIIVVFNTAKLLTRSYDQKKFYLYLCWYIPSILMMLLFTERYTSNPHQAYTLAEMALPTLFAIVVPTLFTIVAGLGILVRHVKAQWMRSALWGILVTSLIIFLFVLVPPQQLIDTFLDPAGTESFTATVSEFNEPSLSHWFNQYRLFFIFPLLGLLLVTYSLTETYRMHAKVVTGILTTALAAMILSTHPNMQHRLMEIIYLGSVILCIGAIGVSYLRNSYKRQDPINLYTDLLLFLLIWALFTLLYNRGALRFVLFLVPPAVILGAYAIMFILKRAARYNDSRVANLAMLMCFLVLVWQLRTPCLAFLINIGLDGVMSSLICANLMILSVIMLLLRGNQEFSTEKKSSVKTKAACLILSIAICIITGGVPHLLPNWISQNVTGNIPASHEIKAFNWLKTHTPIESVVAAWWDYGSRIEALGERATIVDQQHNLPRIHSMTREVFCAETPEEALKFLKSHKATHLMIPAEDVFKNLKGIVATGFPEDTALNILTESFRIDEQASNASDASQEKPTQQISPQSSEHSNSSEGTKERYLPCSKKNASTKHADVEYKADGSFHKASIRIDDMNTSPMYVIFDKKKTEKNIEGSGSLVITNVDVHRPHRTLEYKHAMYFNEEACNLLIFQLYFLGSHTDHFEQVYPTQEMETEDSSPFDDIKIWKINY
ncbi:MAG: hypothetical protein OXH00_07995 [Candidatus Poribacteria bacterium]|nr:hypothetical protein [Candidatus Poribacteria bacterium]